MVRFLGGVPSLIHTPLLALLRERHVLSRGLFRPLQPTGALPRALPANRFCRSRRHVSMLVDRDDLALAAVQADSFKKTGDKTLPRNDRVGVGAALHVEAVRAARDEVGVECLLAVVDADRPGSRPQ